MKLYKPHSEKIKMLVYGKGGTGKTRFVGSSSLCEGMAPALMLSIGGNPVSLRSYDPPPIVMAVDSQRDFSMTYSYFLAGQPPTHKMAAELAKLMGQAPPVFKTLIIDGATTVQFRVMRSILKMQSDDDVDFSKLAPDMEASDYKVNLGTMAQWGALMFGLADDGVASPIHVLMTALEHDPSPDLRGKAAMAAGAKAPPPEKGQYRPYFIGSVVALIEAEADIIARMQPIQFTIGETRRESKKEKGGVWNAAHFKMTEEQVAKDQFGALPDVMFDPTMQEVYDLIYKDK